jgi:hypothetical protein
MAPARVTGHSGMVRATASPGGMRKRTAFPRPCGTVPRRSAGPGKAKGQRPPWAGRALAGGFGPPAGLGSMWRCGRGDGPCQSDRAFRHGQGHRVSGRDQETHAFPRPSATVPRRSAGPGTTRGQRPTRRAGSARRWRGGRWPGALGPRLAKGQRGAMAGAMAPAFGAVKVLSSVRAGPGNAVRFPARARRFPADRQVRE